MKGSEAKLVSYMEGNDKRFVIPVYQRNYDWKIENCKQLYNDLINVILNRRRSHFFGSIVSVYVDGAFNEYLVIDGQQRLTTVSLLFLAMYNLMKSGIVKPQRENLAEKIYNTYLIDQWRTDETRIKLKPVKNDSAAFAKLFGDESEHVPDSNLTINYNYFYSRICRQEITIDELFDAVTRLEIINITLNQEDNPQLIFESLNSTGLALSEGDKIRNFVLMGLEPRQQNLFYEKYWNRIEIHTGYNVSLFIRDYLSIKRQQIPSVNKVYFQFKEYVEESAIDTETLLSDLLDYAKRYEILLKGNTADKQLNACIVRLNKLETTVTRPFFLEVLRLQSEGRLTADEVRDIFLYTENYLFRRLICDMTTSALNKIFLKLHSDIVRYDGTEEKYAQKFKYALCGKTDNGRFPDDREFAEAFATRPIYLMNSKNKIYILERFENFGTVEVRDIYSGCEEGVYTIEHIMPQHLTPVWMKSLGDDYEEIYETWLHRIANLTLTGYNSKYSNAPFEEKRDMNNGFADSHLHINQWIAHQKQWGLAELEERSRLLTEQALTIWPQPQSAYRPPQKQFEEYALNEDADFTGREIIRFRYKNTEYPVGSWSDMMEQVLQLLHAEDNSVFAKAAYATNGMNDLSTYVSSDPQALRSPLKIAENIYFEKNTSTSFKISLLHRLFSAYQAEESDLVFFLKEAGSRNTDEQESAGKELKRRYWAFALPLIRQEHGDETSGGCFSNRTTSGDDWISGTFGISGFRICCVLTKNKARVSLILGNARAQRNKESFDDLYSNRERFEKELATSLIWKRNDDIKNSIVMVETPSGGFQNEEEWPKTARFHAEWSKKFYDTFVPYLKQRY